MANSWTTSRILPTWPPCHPKEPGHESLRPRRTRRTQPAGISTSQFVNDSRHLRRGRVAGRDAVARDWPAAAGDETSGEVGTVDTVVVTSRRDLRNFNREEDRGGPTPAESPALDEPSRQKIEQLPNVTETYPDLRFITSFNF